MNVRVLSLKTDYLFVVIEKRLHESQRKDEAVVYNYNRSDGAMEVLDYGKLIRKCNFLEQAYDFHLHSKDPDFLNVRDSQA